MAADPPQTHNPRHGQLTTHPTTETPNGHGPTTDPWPTPPLTGDHRSNHGDPHLDPQTHHEPLTTQPTTETPNGHGLTVDTQPIPPRLNW